MDAVEIVQALHELGVTLRAQGINLCLEPGSKVPAGCLASGIGAQINRVEGTYLGNTTS